MADFGRLAAPPIREPYVPKPLVTQTMTCAECVWCKEWTPVEQLTFELWCGRCKRDKDWVDESDDEYASESRLCEVD